MFGTLLEIVESDRKLATSNKATEVQSVFSQLSASCIPLAVKCRGLLPVASCCVVAGGNRTFTTLEVCRVRKIARFVFQSTNNTIPQVFNWRYNLINIYIYAYIIIYHISTTMFGDELDLEKKWRWILTSTWLIWGLRTWNVLTELAVGCDWSTHGPTSVSNAPKQGVDEIQHLANWWETWSWTLKKEL